MGVLDIAAPALQALDDSLAAMLPSAPRLGLWGAVAGSLTMLLYWLISPQARIAEARRELLHMRRALDAYEGELAGAGRLIRAMLGQALRQLGLVLFPVIVAAVPVICIAAWLDTAYGYDKPGAAPVAVRILPADLSARWQESAAHPAQPAPGEVGEVLVNDASGRSVEVVPLAKPVAVLRKPRWWDSLLGPAASYLPRDGRAERIEIALPRREFLSFGPAWWRGWEALFFAALFAAALLLKLVFRIA